MGGVVEFWVAVVVPGGLQASVGSGGYGMVAWHHGVGGKGYGGEEVQCMYGRVLMVLGSPGWRLLSYALQIYAGRHSFFLVNLS